MNRKGEDEEKENSGRKRKNVGERKSKVFLAFQWSNLDSPRIKVGLCNESYL